MTMDFNPHSLHQILTRIREQMRCPQCGTKVPVDFPAVKLAGDSFMLLQLRCESCTAFIVLHVNLGETPTVELADDKAALLNASSTLSLSEDEMKTLRSALGAFDGSFQKMFQDFEKAEKKV
jgi:hypothetical protein